MAAVSLFNSVYAFMPWSFGKNCLCTWFGLEVSCMTWLLFLSFIFRTQVFLLLSWFSNLAERLMHHFLHLSRYTLWLLYSILASCLYKRDCCKSAWSRYWFEAVWVHQTRPYNSTVYFLRWRPFYVFFFLVPCGFTSLNSVDLPFNVHRHYADNWTYPWFWTWNFQRRNLSKRAHNAACITLRFNCIIDLRTGLHPDKVRWILWVEIASNLLWEIFCFVSYLMKITNAKSLEKVRRFVAIIGFQLDYPQLLLYSR